MEADQKIPQLTLYLTSHFTTARVAKSRDPPDARRRSLHDVAGLMNPKIGACLDAGVAMVNCPPVFIASHLRLVTHDEQTFDLREQLSERAAVMLYAFRGHW